MSVDEGKIERLGGIFVTGLDMVKQAMNHSIVILLSEVKADDIACLCAGAASAKGRS